MEAGQGAAEQARRLGVRIAGLEAELEKARKQQRAWLTGAEGEARVGEQLAALERHGWRILHDVHWPGRPKANIDHIAVGPGGVVVIDTKNWSGDVVLRDGVLRQNGQSREQQTASVLEQCSAVAVLLEPRHRNLVRGCVCLVGQPDLKGTSASGTVILGIEVLVDTVLALPVVLEAQLVGVVFEYVRDLIAGETSPVVATTALLDRADTPSILDARRSAVARHPSARRSTVRPAPTSRSKPRRPRQKHPSCLGALGRLVLLALVLWLSAGALQSFGSSRVTPVPQPVPTVEQVAPDVGAPAPPG